MNGVTLMFASIGGLPAKNWKVWYPIYSKGWSYTLFTFLIGKKHVSDSIWFSFSKTSVVWNCSCKSWCYWCLWCSSYCVFLTLFTTLPCLAFSAVAFILSVMGCCSWYFSMAFSYCFSPFVLCFWLFVAMPLIRFSAVVSWVILLSSYKSTTLLIFCWIVVGTRPVCLSLKALKKLIFFLYIFTGHILIYL